MAKRVREIRDLIIDEVSLVDKGANQHAAVTIAKSYDGEEEQGMDIYDEQGNPLDADSLEDGAIVYGEDGQAYLFEIGDEDGSDEVEAAYEEELEPELVGVGKAFRQPVAKRSSVADTLREELSKALTDADRDQAISKALGMVDQYAEQAHAAEEIAKAERELRLDREYTEIAKGYNLPVHPEVLGPVMKRLAEAMTEEDCVVIAKCFEAAGEALFEETGYRGGGDNVDIYQQVEAAALSTVGKAAGVTHEQAVADVFAQNPGAYDEYLAETQY